MGIDEQIQQLPPLRLYYLNFTKLILLRIRIDWCKYKLTYFMTTLGAFASKAPPVSIGLRICSLHELTFPP